VNLSLNGPIFAFVALLCLGSTFAFGLVPALHISRTNVNDALKDSGAGTSGGLRARRWSAALIVGELALTVVLLAAAGLMVRSFVRLYRTDLVIEQGWSRRGWRCPEVRDSGAATSIRRPAAGAPAQRSVDCVRGSDERRAARVHRHVDAARRRRPIAGAG
jgi:hypothetical protein